MMSFKKSTFFRTPPIFDICATRRFENLDGCNMFLILYWFIIEALEVKALKLHLEKYPEWLRFDQESRSGRNRVMGSLRNFSFLIVWIIKLYHKQKVQLRKFKVVVWVYMKLSM